MLERKDMKPYDFTNAGIMCYTKAISNLRQKGYNIITNKELKRNKDGSYESLHTSYHLVK